LALEDGKRLLWLTDLHLNKVSPLEIDELLEEMAVYPCEAIVITGDISDGYYFLDFLEKTHETLFHKPIYFVLGNHDYYHSSIEDTRKLATKISEKISSIHYLTTSPILELTPHTAIIGHDSWADGRHGDFFSSTVKLRDFYAIEDFIGLKPEQRKELMHKLGDEAAAFIKKQLTEALENYSKVILLTHIPPFVEACCYRGIPADENWGPFFLCQAVGDVLLEVMDKNPDSELLVLCGHTHHQAQVEKRPNILVLTGEVSIGEPSVQQVIPIR
jgi:predicted MPP superfamily phosphohydrolase